MWSSPRFFWHIPSSHREDGLWNPVGRKSASIRAMGTKVKKLGLDVALSGYVQKGNAFYSIGPFCFGQPQQDKTTGGGNH